MNLTSENMQFTLYRLMNDPMELACLGGAARRIGTTNAANTVARRLLELAGQEAAGLMKKMRAAHTSMFLSM